MPFVNGGHLWLILALIVLLVIFGPGRLPELGSAMGKTINAFKRSTADLRSEISHHEIDHETAGSANPVQRED